MWIAHSDFPFDKHPVLHLDFSIIEHSSPQALPQNLCNHLTAIAQRYEITLEKTTKMKDLVVELISKLAKQNKVVLLIDNYDHPLREYINTNPERALENQSVLKDFYDAIKSLDLHIRALFVTGGTKLAKTTILSHVYDISEDPEFADLLGYTEEELKSFCGDQISQYAIKKQSSLEAVYRKIKTDYYGYRFSRAQTTVYNPSSIASYLTETTAVPSSTLPVIAELLKNNPTELTDIEQKVIDASSLKLWDIGTTPFIVILYQLGYLTIGKYSMLFKTLSYTLRYPNKETRLRIARILSGAHHQKETRR